MTLNDRVREFLKEEKKRRGLSERDLGTFANWSQSKVTQKLNGRTPITLDELETLCFALTISPTEAVRDRGLEFCADLTPSELRILEMLRHLPRTAADGLRNFLQIQDTDPKPVELRGATPRRPIFGKPRNKG